MLHETPGHEDAVLALDLCEAGGTLNESSPMSPTTGVSSPGESSLEASPANGPSAHETLKPQAPQKPQRWLLSVGADRVVKLWTLDLKKLGQLTSVGFDTQI